MVSDSIDGIRQRPGMYVGDVRDGSGLLHMVWEVVGNAFDQNLIGACTRIDVTIHEDGAVTVEDNGQGISVERQDDGRSFVELALTTFHDRATLDGHRQHTHLDGHGLGLFVVTALSEYTRVETVRDGQLHRIETRAAVVHTPLENLGPTDRRGTRVTFLPDRSIFRPAELNAHALRERLRDLAALRPGLVFGFHDARRAEYVSPNGLLDLLAHQAGHPCNAVGTPIRIAASVGRVHVEVVMQWGHGHTYGVVRSFVNCFETRSGGTHVIGLERGIDELLLALPERDRPSMRRALADRLVAIVAVQHDDPTFDSPTRSELTNPDVRPVVESAVRSALREFERTQPRALAELFASVRRAHDDPESLS